MESCMSLLEKNARTPQIANLFKITLTVTIQEHQNQNRERDEIVAKQ
jgi:hypothetical protein